MIRARTLATIFLGIGLIMVIFFAILNVFLLRSFRMDPKDFSNKDSLDLLINNQKTSYAQYPFVLGNDLQISASDPANQQSDISRLTPISKTVVATVHQDSGKFKVDSPFSQPTGGFELKVNPKLINDLDIVFDKDRQTLSFAFSSENYALNNRSIQNNGFVLGKIDQVAPNSLVKIGSEILIDLTSYQNDISVRADILNQNQVEIYTPQTSNLLSSFEEGPWQDAPSDCSQVLPGKPDFTMNISKDATDGQNSLLLGSKNHFACVARSFAQDFNPEKLYLLTLDYKNLAGYHTSFYYNLINEDELVAEETISLNPQNQNWQTETTIIQPAKNATKMSLFLYATAQNFYQETNLYDNIRLSEYSAPRTVKIDLKGRVGQTQALEKNLTLNEENTIEYKNSEENLLPKLSSSFEEGPWQNNPSDCSQILPGEPDFEMKTTDDATDGQNSLLLGSKNHFACVARSFNVRFKKNFIYELSFDYKALEDSKVSFYYYLKSQSSNISRGNLKELPTQEIVQTDGLNIQVKNPQKWEKFSTFISTDNQVNINSIGIFLYAQSDGSSQVVNLYDNLRLTEVSPRKINNFFFQKTQSLNSKSNAGSITSDSSLLNQSFTFEAQSPTLLVYQGGYVDNREFYIGRNLFPYGKTVPKDLIFKAQSNKYPNQTVLFVDPNQLCTQNSCPNNKITITVFPTWFRGFLLGQMILAIIYFLGVGVYLVILKKFFPILTAQ